MASYRRYVDTRRASSQAPQPGVFVSGYRDDYAPDYARFDVKPAKLAMLMRRADEGHHQSQQEVFSACLEDPHVHSVFDKRVRRVLSRRLQISPAVEGDKRSQQAADLVRQVCIGDDGHGAIANWRQSLRDLSEAVFRGFALSQIVWQNDGGLWRPAELQWWDQRWCALGDPLTQLHDYNADDVRVITDADIVRGEQLEPNQWIVHKSKARSAPLARAALGRMVVWWWLFKRFAAKDWMIFCDRYGGPLRVGKYPRGAQDEERNALYDAVLTLGKDSGAVMPEGTSIEFIETAQRGTLPQPPLVEVCDFQISKAILGGTLTTDAGEKGARSLGEVHERNETDIAEDDGLALAETLRRDLFRPIVGFNLGWDVPVPRIEWPSEEQEDLLARAQRDKIVIKDLGLPVKKRQVYETYGWEEPADDDELLDVAPSGDVGASQAGPQDVADVDDGGDSGDGGGKGAGGSKERARDARDAESALRAASLLGLSLADVVALKAAKKKSARWAM